MVLIGLLCGLAQAIGVLAMPTDAVAYWAAGTSTDLYPEQWGTYPPGQWLFYPPPVAQLSEIVQPIGWPLFVTLWTTLVFASMWYCARRWSLPLLALGIPAVFGIDIPFADTFLAYALLGNMHWILAALSVLALRHPALWSIQLMTKIGTAVGWWWHVFRGEWRKAFIAAAASVGILVASVALDPQLWSDFGAFVLANASMADPPFPTFPVPLTVRAPTALLLVLWGARTDRPWTVPVACGWALPALYGLGFLPFWVAAATFRSRARTRPGR